MAAIASLRRITFWMLDKVKGAPIKAAYTDIRKIDGLDSFDTFIEEYQTSAFRRLIKEARENTKFYADYVGEKLAEFPVINKNDIRSNQRDFLSNRYQKDELIQMATSGSTGTSFVCYQNSYKKSG